jgi:hypothetical protein
VGTSNIGDSGANTIGNLVTVPLMYTEGVVQVVTGESTTCLLFTNGRIVCFGDNQYGIVGRDDTANVGLSGTTATLRYIEFSDTLPAIQIALSRHTACAIHTNGRVRIRITGKKRLACILP